MFSLRAAHAQTDECTKLGLFAGAFSNPDLLDMLEDENAQITRAFFNENAIHLLAADTQQRAFLVSTLQDLHSRGIESVITLRFPYICADGTDCDPTQDRILTDPDTLQRYLDDLRIVLQAAKDDLDYLQVLNEPLGAGSYDSMFVSLPQSAAIAWFDTIVGRVKAVRDDVAPNIELISPSVVINGLKSIATGAGDFSEDITRKTFEVANQYCDGISYHWYPSQYSDMVDMLTFLDTTNTITLRPDLYEVSTEWSQGHEFREIMAQDTARWRSILQPLCNAPAPGNGQAYLDIISDSLGVDYGNIWRMYALMNARNYRFAVYFSLVQGYIDLNNCNNIRNYWYALGALYATGLTENGVPAGELYDAYQAMKDSIAANCGASSRAEFHNAPELQLYPNPASNSVQLHWSGTPGEVLLYDAHGRLIRQWPLYGNQQVLLLEGIPAGVYLLRAQAHSGSAQQRRLLVH
ncbi:MAG: T9SS type A sorting domain-containing protein [Bacteroidota bacterium]